MKPVILETPYKGHDWKNTEENLQFARLCIRDCIMRGEAPFASHLLYTQKGVLDDTIPQERELGIKAGFEWKNLAKKTVAYIDLGISDGMKKGLEKSMAINQPIEYRTLRPLKIVTITGQSGVGKTSVAGKLLELWPEIKMLLSLTTRSARITDLPGEYRCNVAQEEFTDRNLCEDFVWTCEAYGNKYGTLKKSVDEALASHAPSLMLIIPEIITTLRNYVGARGSVVSFYILAPREEELRRRLESRGENTETIERRISESKKWDEEARGSDLPYIFVSCEKPVLGIEKTAREILGYLSAR